MVASPSPITGIRTAARASARSASAKWPITNASYPCSSAVSAFAIACAAQRKSVIGCGYRAPGWMPDISTWQPGLATEPR